MTSSMSAQISSDSSDGRAVVLSGGPGLLTISLARDLDRGQDRLGLVHALLVLGVRAAVGDDAGARLDVDGVALGDQGSNGNGEVEVARIGQISDGAAVEAPTRGLELLDDLH